VTPGGPLTPADNLVLYEYAYNPYATQESPAPSRAGVRALLAERDDLKAELAVQVAARQTAEQALKEADRLASLAHDAMWSKSVASNGAIHDGDDPDSASSCIHRLHAVVRPALVVLATADGEKTP
jgi:hypothetical protein